jgi:iron complex outermembrane recepter protein
MLDIPQGKYIDTVFDMRVTYKNFGFVLGVTNLFNVKGNRFSLGNPFGVTDRLQETPLRPRTIRIGLDAAF